MEGGAYRLGGNPAPVRGRRCRLREFVSYRLLSVASLLAFATVARAADLAEPDWTRIGSQAAQLLARYVRLDTQNPPGVTTEAVVFLEELLSESGLQSERIVAEPNKPILAARLRGRGNLARPIILLNHIDVVPAEEDRWSVPPFSGEIRGGALWGRGSLDIKSFAIAQLLALRLLARRNERPNHDIVFLAVPDEEIGGGGGVRWLSQNRPDLVDAAGVWDEGGFGLADAFPKPVVFISITEKRALWIRVVADGPAGHGSRPFAEAATHRLTEALQRILDRPFPSRLTPTARTSLRRMGRSFGGVRGFVMRHVDNPLIWPLARGFMERDPLTNSSIRDTISVTMLEGGYKPNVIPETAEAVLDCRLLPGTQEETFLGELRRVIDDPAIRLEILESTTSAPASPVRNDLFRAIERAARSAYPDATVTPFMSVGTTDSRFFRQRGVPAYGLTPMVLPQELLTTIHGVDERVPTGALGPAVRVVYETLRQL